VTHTLLIPMSVVLVAVGVASVTDLWKFKVPNLITLPLLGSGLLFHGVSGGWEGLGRSVLGCLFGFGILIGFYLLGGMGAGDVKLLAALGSWLGPVLTAYLFVVSALAAGIYSFVLILMYGRLADTWHSLQVIYYRLAILGRYFGAEDRVEAGVKAWDRRRRVIPFAAMMGLGLIALLIWLWWQGPN
jgi:prepilin peptidase CpaA